MPVLTLPRFKRAIRLRRAGAKEVCDLHTPLLRKDFFGVAPAVVDDQTIRFTISTAALDSDFDTVSVEGWDLSRYRKNPVVLWSHDTELVPIGKSVDIGPDAGALMATVKFQPADRPVIGPLAECVRLSLLDGFLSAASVGFMPLEYTVSDDPARNADGWFPGIDFQRQMLMEWSIVDVPALDEALVDPDVQADPDDPLAPLLDDARTLAAGALALTAKLRRRRQLALLNLA